MSAPNLIEMFLHCRKCIAEWTERAKTTRVSPRDEARVSVGITQDMSLQVWCNRHDQQIALFSSPEVKIAMDKHFGANGGSCGICGCEPEGSSHSH